MPCMHAIWLKNYHDILTFPLHHITSLSLNAETLLDGGLESLGVRANDFLDLLPVLEQQEGGHGADAEVLGDVGDLVDVELVEACVGVGGGKSLGGKD